MNSTITILVGLFLLLVGGGLLFWSYFNRDPVTGELIMTWNPLMVWSYAHRIPGIGEYLPWITLLAGGVTTVAGLMQRNLKEQQPL